MKSKKIPVFLLAVFTFATVALPLPAADAPKPGKGDNGFVDLFDGKTLDGWTHDPLGKAEYAVVDGTIVGTTVEGSPNSFLLSEKEYGDFELQFDVWVDTGLNSGVQIRSRPKAGKDIAAEQKGKKNEAPGRVFGPQVEIESSPGQAGYIYGEATGLGWLSKEPLDKDHAHSHLKNDQWNTFRVVARGPRIQTWINGEQIATLVHEEVYGTHPKGHIGLQVHGIKPGTGPFSVRWRNLKIREFPASGNNGAPAAKPKPAAKAKPGATKATPPAAKPAPVAKKAKKAAALFDGKSLEGWMTGQDDHFWAAKDGMLARVAPEGKKGGGYVWTKEKYGDFTLDLDFKVSEGCNSGIFIRTDPKNAVQGGFEIQVFDSSGVKEPGKHDCGALYDAMSPAMNAEKPVGEWNHIRISCDGPKISVVLNDKKVVDANLDEWATANLNPDGSKNKFKTALKDLPRTGHIGFQDHGHDVWFRNITIEG